MKEELKAKLPPLPESAEAKERIIRRHCGGTDRNALAWTFTEVGARNLLVDAINIGIAYGKAFEALSSLPPGGGWQPWATAPKDGTEILVRYPHQGNTLLLVAFNTVHNHWHSKGVPKLGIDLQDVEWLSIDKDGPSSPASTVSRKEEA